MPYTMPIKMKKNVKGWVESGLNKSRDFVNGNLKTAMENTIGQVKQ